MCFIIFAVNAHADYPLIVVANRDEYLNRETRAAAFWDDHPDVLAGRDLKAGGTWLGITRHGRFAALTNYRDASDTDASRPSRGALVSDFLVNAERPPAANYIQDVHHGDADYNGYNLVAGAGSALVHYSNQTGKMELLTPGIHVLSNALLNTPWPKAKRGRAELKDILAKPGPVDDETLFDLLADRQPAVDDNLPDTGVGLEAERALSPIFIRHGSYGTRCSTIIRIQTDGLISFSERSFGDSADDYSDAAYEFRIIE